MLSVDFWHKRFVHQLKWTRKTRDFIYRKLHFSKGKTFLELGSGSGALLSEVISRVGKSHANGNKSLKFVGIDKNQEYLDYAREILSPIKGINLSLIPCDATEIPLEDKSMDFIFCNYFFMWNDDGKKEEIVREGTRLLRPGGYFVIFSEPDYQSRIDFPDHGMNTLLNNYLRSKNADIQAGRKILSLLSKFNNKYVDTCSSTWTSELWKDNFTAEWFYIENVIRESVPDDMDLLQVKQKEKIAIEAGEKFTFMPTFFGFGRKPWVS